MALLVFHAAAAVRTAPNYIAFSNDFFGGVDNTYKVLADSNVDWGQSVKLAGEYLARENITDCWFAGNLNVEINRLEQPCRLLPGVHDSRVGTEQLIEPTPPVIEGTILLSAWVLPPASVSLYPPYNVAYSPVTQSKLIAIIGGSILVYRGRFEVPLVAALSHIERARQLIDLNRFEEAVADGLKAVEFAPDDPNSHVVLGIGLARSGRRDEARREFETAVRLAAGDSPMFPWVMKEARSELGRL
jgi:tetratricopeptide (TPR) repeat protein